MKAFILAAGFGTRLGLLTKNKPKSLVDIGGMAAIDHVIDNLKKVGVSSVVINTHYLSQMVVDHVKGMGNYGIEVCFAHENPILGTGGGLKNTRTYFEKEEFFVIHNADVYSKINLEKMIGKHKLNNPVATLAISNGEESSYLLFSENLELIGVQKRGGEDIVFNSVVKNIEKKVFCGIHVVSNEIFSFLDMDKRKEFSIIDTYLDIGKSGKKILGFEIDEDDWIDIGTPERLDKVRKDLEG